MYVYTVKSVCWEMESELRCVCVCMYSERSSLQVQNSQHSRKRRRHRKVASSHKPRSLPQPTLHRLFPLLPLPPSPPPPLPPRPPTPCQGRNSSVPAIISRSRPSSKRGEGEGERMSTPLFYPISHYLGVCRRASGFNWKES